MWGGQQKKEALESIRKAVEAAMDHPDEEETELLMARANESIREMKEAVESGKKKGDLKPAEAKELLEWAEQQEALLEATVAGGKVVKVVKIRKQQDAFERVEELAAEVEKAIEQAIAEGGLDDPERAALVKAKAELLREAIAEAQSLLDDENNNDDPDVKRRRAALERVLESAEGVGTVGPGKPTAEEQQERMKTARALMQMEREMAEVELSLAKGSEEGKDKQNLWTQERKRKILAAMRAAAQASVDQPGSEEAAIAVARAKAEIADMQEAVSEAKARGELSASEEKEMKEWAEEQSQLLDTAVEGAKVENIVRARQQQEALEQVVTLVGECSSTLATAISEGGLDDPERSARVKAKAEQLREAVGHASDVNAPLSVGTGGGKSTGGGDGGEGGEQQHQTETHNDATRRQAALNRVLQSSEGLGEPDRSKIVTPEQQQVCVV